MILHSILIHFFFLIYFYFILFYYTELTLKQGRLIFL